MNGTMPDMVRIRPTFPVLLGDTAREDTILPYSGWAVSSHDSIQCTAKLVFEIPPKRPHVFPVRAFVFEWRKIGCIEN